MRLTRRAFLLSAVSMGGIALLASCGPAAPTSPAPAATTQPAAGAPAAKPSTATAVGTQPTTTAPAAARSGGMLILADSWDAPDPKSYVLHLKQGLHFTDGTDFDAAAVKFNMDRHLDPKTASKQIGTLLSVASVEATDKSTVRFNLKAPSAAFMSTFFDRVGFIASPAAVQKWGNNDYGLHPVGVGPFQLVDYKADQQYVVQRNPNYWDKGRPYLDSITFKDIPVDATRETELRSGGAHMAEDLPLQDVERMRTMTEFHLSERSGARFY